MHVKTSAARHLALRRLLQTRRIGSQEELVKLVAEQGHRATQTTISRDLAALGAVKASDNNGEFYTIGSTPPADQAAAELARVLGEFVVSIDSSLNLAVLRTTPGSAGTVAAALDASKRSGVLATLAGDDTVLVVTARSDGGSREAERLRRVVAGA